MDILCPHYKSQASSKRCVSYIKNGACRRKDHLMCVEWVRKNEPRGGLARRVVTPPESVAPTDRTPPASPEAVDSWKRMGTTVHLTTPGGKLAIVPEYTGQDRNELSVAHATVIEAVLRAFPGTRILEFERMGGDA
jgi:hypothetical protein